MLKSATTSAGIGWPSRRTERITWIKGGLAAVDRAFEKGVVLAMSLWDDHEANMLWLDSIYPTDGQQAGSKRGTCSTDSGVPAEVEAQHCDSKVIFSKPVQVTTQFITSDGTDSGNFVSVTVLQSERQADRASSIHREWQPT